MLLKLSTTFHINPTASCYKGNLYLHKCISDFTGQLLSNDWIDFGPTSKVFIQYVPTNGLIEGQMIGRSVHVRYTDRWVFDGEHQARKEVVFSPGQTRVRPVHLVEAWRQSPAQETSCRCRSPGWSLRLPAAPWHSHSAGMGSCNAARWAGTGCLGPEWFNTVKHTSASNCNYACSPWAVSHIKIKRRGVDGRGLKRRLEF